MDSRNVDQMIRTAGAVLKSMKTGPECPGDDRLLDFVYGTLSQAEHQEVRTHTRECPLCRFEVMKIEADRAAWEIAFEEAPDAALSHALRPGGLARVRKMAASRITITPVHSPAGCSPSSAEERYLVHIKAGLERFEAALTTVAESLLRIRTTLSAHEEQTPYGTRCATRTVRGEKHAPALPVPEVEDFLYQTSILAAPERKEIMVLMKNRKVGKDRHIHPDLDKTEEGRRRLYLILSPAPLEIDGDEAIITPDRFVEIMARAEEMCSHVESMDPEGLERQRT